MTKAYEIPLKSIPQQLRISILGTVYILTVQWCSPAQTWLLDIQIAGSLAYVLRAIPLVTGADLLAQYRYLGIGCSLIVQTDHATLTQPTFSNLGKTAHLFVVTA